MKGKVISILVLLVLLLGAFWFTCIDRVEPGYVGIKCNRNSGTLTEVNKIGWVFVNPVTTKFTEYPVSTEQLILTKANTEGSEGDDSLDVPTKEGQNVSLDCAVNFHVEKAKNLFLKYRGIDLDTVKTRVIRNSLNSCLMATTGKYSILEINASRNVIAKETRDAMNKILVPQGIRVETIDLRAIRLPHSVQASFNAKIEAENKIRQAESELKRAEVEAKTAITIAEGQAKANLVLSNSLTPQLLQLKSIEKLNPNVQTIYVPSNTSMLMNMPKAS